jgi:hypothetical protein
MGNIVEMEQMAQKTNMEEKLTLVWLNGLYLVGKRIVEYPHALKKPRSLTFEEKGQIRMTPLPFLPSSVNIPSGALVYDIAEGKYKEVFDLYNKVTDPKVDPGD